MSERQDPFYNLTHSAAGATQSHVQPQPAPHVSLVSHLNEQSLRAIRQIVRDEVHSDAKTAHEWRDTRGMPIHGVTYRGYSLQELDAMVDFYLNKGGK